MPQYEETVQIDPEKPIAVPGGEGVDPAIYDLVEPGWYVAIVESVGYDTYSPTTGNYAGHKFGKFTPSFRLLNEVGTKITKQGFTWGILNDAGVPYRPDGDTSKQAVFGDSRFLAQALGEQDPVTGKINWDETLWKDRAVQVQITHKEYTNNQGDTRHKNFVAQVRPVTAKQIEEHHLYLAENRAFMTEASYKMWKEQKKRAAQPQGSKNTRY